MVMRGLISGLAPRAQSDLGFIEKTAMMMQRMDASRTAELGRLAEEEKRAPFITPTLLYRSGSRNVICCFRAHFPSQTPPTRAQSTNNASSRARISTKDGRTPKRERRTCERTLRVGDERELGVWRTG